MERTIPLLRTPVDDNGLPGAFRFTGKLNKLTLKIEPPVLTPYDAKRLEQAVRDNCASQ